MTDHTPPTGQQLDEYEALATAATSGPWHLTDSDAIVAPLTGVKVADVWETTHASRNGEFIEVAREAVPALVAEVRRLRAESEQRTEALASADNPTHLRWGLNDVLWGDDDTVIVLLSGPDREPYWLELEPERATVLREDLAGPPAEDPVTAAPTRQLTASEYNAAWHAVEGAAGEEGADPGTVLHAVLDRLGIEWQTAAHPDAAPAAGVTGEGTA